MSLVHLRRGAAVLAAAAVAGLLASCSTPEPAVVEAPPAPVVLPPPPVTLNASVADAASIYVNFIRDVGTIQAGFPDAESIQQAMRKGAAYDPAQLSRGMIAYASILALQSPEFVAGVRQYAVDPAQRRQVVAAIINDPAYAATLPGADYAAGLIISTLGQDISALTTIADAVEGDAYTIQERQDPRRRWAITPIPNREVRLQQAKTISEGRMLPSAEESARLFAAGNSGQGLNVASAPIRAPYTPAVANALAIAALAALGAAGDEAKANTDALAIETGSEFCLNMSKLNLYQCLAASRPSYEDMFCVGRHIVRDLATCASTSTRTAIITVTDPTDTTGQPAPTVSLPQPGTTASLNQSPASAGH
ncbi:hypothetical protein [Brevundimonas goettingensis]|uniref:Lipoprotein n=1 Tax=Brevundimonas goettingensis TaxID=2774190 RepID=A0A975BZK3_9CAUL|nr:hypothetical protein [Brevundimonas goettingensis]QTC90014.1 hypothetical protein IFJ75_12005 [Brevundimonas goettingensis]